MVETNEIANKRARLRFLDERKTDLNNRISEIDKEMAYDQEQEPENC